MVKNLPAMWETQVQSLGQEDPLKKEMATHSSIKISVISIGSVQFSHSVMSDFVVTP